MITHDRLFSLPTAVRAYVSSCGAVLAHMTIWLLRRNQTAVDAPSRQSWNLVAMKPRAQASSQLTTHSILISAGIWARSQSFDWLSIEVFEANVRALALYEKVGYRKDITRLIKQR